MNARRSPRGQPLLALALLLSTWVGARVAIVTGTDDLATAAESLTVPTAPRGAAPGAAAAMAPTATASADRATLAQPAQRAEPAWTTPEPMPLAPAPLQRPVTAEPLAEPPPAPVSRAVPVRVAAGHQLLWMAALSMLPDPGELAPVARRPVRVTEPRWSGDGWVLWRRGGAGSAAAGFAPSTYGASQAGAVIRYRLAPGNSHRPALYLRATTALEAPRGEEVAFGLAARPLAHVPVVALVEARATRFPGATRVRPAAALVSEIPPFALPAKARGEVYLQAGYVGGPGATAFADGSLRIDRPLISLGKAELRAGGGAWGGAQKGASRLDLGPGVTLGVPLGERARARVAADWRFRIAGSAAPTSGPAVTLSAGF